MEEVNCVPCPPAWGPQTAGSRRRVMLPPHDITTSQSEDGPAVDHTPWDPLPHSVFKKKRFPEGLQGPGNEPEMDSSGCSGLLTMSCLSVYLDLHGVPCRETHLSLLLSLSASIFTSLSASLNKGPSSQSYGFSRSHVRM